MMFDESISFKEYFKLLEARGRGGAKAKGSNYGGANDEKKTTSKSSGQLGHEFLSPQNVTHAEPTKTRGSKKGAPQVGDRLSNRAEELKMSAGAAAPLTSGKFFAAFQDYETDPITGDWKLDDKGNRIPKEKISAIAPKELIKRLVDTHGIIQMINGKPHKVGRFYEETEKPLIGGTLNNMFSQYGETQTVSRDLFARLRYMRSKYKKHVPQDGPLPLKVTINDEDLKSYLDILLDGYQKMFPESVMEINGKKYITSYISPDNDWADYDTDLATNIKFKPEKIVRREVVPENALQKAERLVDFIDGNEAKGIQGNYRFKLIYNLTDNCLVKFFDLERKTFVNPEFPEFTSYKTIANGKASQFLGVGGIGSMESGHRVKDTAKGFSKGK
jgi:hypothetical protein